ncbi:hypothetical protein [Micromonospora wenchangensis]|uniref:hypothetical protein n=1 Tax=Micromonospora wenchangensis TaxID=1185415 RepID=UPI003D74A536
MPAARRCWRSAGQPVPHLRLSYACAPPDLMDEAVRRIARVLPAAGRDGGPVTADR